MRLFFVFLLLTMNAVPVHGEPVSQPVQGTEAQVSGTRAAGELFAAADAGGGYSGLVLQQVVPHWQPPAGVNGLARILVRVSAQGRVLSCEPLPDSLPVSPTSSIPAANPNTETIPGTSATVTALTPPPPPVQGQDRVLADLACRAVAAAGDFAVPPYGLLAEVSLILSAGNVRGEMAARPVDYANLVLQRVQPHIEIPARLAGEFTVGVSLRVRGDGGIESVSVTRPSGRKDVDAAIVQALTKPGVVPPPPGGQAQELLLTYTLRNQ